MAFTKKIITLKFTLGGNSSNDSAPTFAGTNADTVTVTGLRVKCKIMKSAGPSINECQLQIYGLLPTVYNALSSIYNVTQSITQNTVTVMAGDDPNNLPVVFSGQINIAQIDLNQQPDCVMNIIAQSAYLQSIKPVPATSYPGSFDVAAAMAALAKLMDMNFENNGVSVVLPSMTLNGTARYQALALAQAAGIVVGFDDNTLVIYPKGGDRAKSQPLIPLISPSTGMIGYPGYGTHGVVLKALYNPNVKWGGQVQVQSSLQVANLNGRWSVFGLAHTLESETPGGRWDTEIQAANFYNIAPVKS